MSPKEKLICFYLTNTVSCAHKQDSLFVGSLFAKYVERKFSFVDPDVLHVSHHSRLRFVSTLFFFLSLILLILSLNLLISFYFKCLV